LDGEALTAFASKATETFRTEAVNENAKTDAKLTNALGTFSFSQLEEAKRVGWVAECKPSLSEAQRRACWADIHSCSRGLGVEKLPCGCGCARIIR